MDYQPNEPLNIHLTELSDEYLRALHRRDESPESFIREASFHRDFRLVALVEEFEKKVYRLRKKRVFSTNDNAIVATFYRDVRVFAVTRGLLDLFRLAFRNENKWKRRMYRTSARRRDHVVACFYSVWGVTSRYGTSMMQWILAGLVLIAAFILVIKTHSPESLGWTESSLLSVETFTQCAYDVSGRPFAIRSALLAERLLGMVYFVFGFSLLIPRLSMELSRTRLTIERSREYEHPDKGQIEINDGN